MQGISALYYGTLAGWEGRAARREGVRESRFVEGLGALPEEKMAHLVWLCSRLSMRA